MSIQPKSRAVRMRVLVESELTARRITAGVYVIFREAKVNVKRRNRARLYRGVTKARTWNRSAPSPGSPLGMWGVARNMRLFHCFCVDSRVPAKWGAGPVSADPAGPVHLADYK